MQKKLQKHIGAILTGFILILLITSCIGKKNKEPVTLTIWHGYAGAMQKSMDSLIEKFNETVGAREGITVKVTGVADSPVVHERLLAAANKDPGAPPLPDIATSYPDVAFILAKMGVAANFEALLDKATLDRYVPDFLAEGKFDSIPEKGLYVLPVGKSTELLYLNRTVFERFAADTGVKLENLRTWEGIYAAAKAWYKWTDEKTPDVPGDGKTFFHYDNLFNYAMIGMEQLGDSLLKNGTLALDNENFRRIWDFYYTGAINGYVTISENFGSHHMQYGDILCSVSSSAGGIYFPDKITWLDNTSENIIIDILPCPVFEGGKKVAVQRGGGMLIVKSTPEREKAAALFLKWFTAPEQNLIFAVTAGYLPVMTDAFTDFEKSKAAEGITNPKIRKTLGTATEMQKDYRFYYAPTSEDMDELKGKFTRELRQTARDAKDGLTPNNPDEAYRNFIQKF
ncbi:MAG: extracellular solute-binding protein [Fusobacteriaceae bacterium]|nr:extracellular solute-binding protein [Fusobacteriaceae bacterium]